MNASCSKLLRQSGSKLPQSKVIHSILQLADPHVAEADGIAVVLESDGELVGMCLVFGGAMRAHPAGAAAEDGVVLD